MKKTLLVVCILAFAAGAHADFGRKMLKKDNVTAVQKADLAFRSMMEVRNKLIEAYREVMRMPM